MDELSKFENYVNYAGSKTSVSWLQVAQLFENYVNYAGSKTGSMTFEPNSTFENYVNYAGSKTEITSMATHVRLRTM